MRCFLAITGRLTPFREEEPSGYAVPRRRAVGSRRADTNGHAAREYNAHHQPLLKLEPEQLATAVAGAASELALELANRTFAAHFLH